MLQTSLSRRERQIMEIIYRLGEATAAQVLEQMHDPPGYSSIRALLRVLVDKQQLQHRIDGPRYVYSPIVSRQKARAGALSHLVNTFFEGSAAKAASALLGTSQGRMTPEELDELSEMIAAARKKGR